MAKKSSSKKSTTANTSQAVNAEVAQKSAPEKSALDAALDVLSDAQGAIKPAESVATAQAPVETKATELTDAQKKELLKQQHAWLSETIKLANENTIDIVSFWNDFIVHFNYPADTIETLIDEYPEELKQKYIYGNVIYHAYKNKDFHYSKDALSKFDNKFNRRVKQALLKEGNFTKLGATHIQKFYDAYLKAKPVLTKAN